ncbi:hypothetical protein VST7929_02982 [Vibrio stylophorae]|uniref:Dinitrogenase iron-molybdenum cofactor biosynthesis domain-containing protein n=1 Tax=Vibrio stylophorae TaxID=659351 RepID=A0ABN8DYJ6_9VIBR|nr:NifB/NifX family molybdenum-iron cluster-binding protein [Vibrio stylophorae]CAH0535409.1 hypothetical protein VST7929_02982 [Vibrio stylophorae]
MIVAMPIQGDMIANHFMRAPEIAVLQGQVNAKQQTITRLTHAQNGEMNCAGKKKLIEALKAQGVQRLYVRNIGQRALGKLLAAGIEVVQVAQKVPYWGLLETTFVPFQDASEGRIPKKHQAGHSSCGGCHHDSKPAPSLLSAPLSTNQTKLSHAKTLQLIKPLNKQLFKPLGKSSNK